MAALHVTRAVPTAAAFGIAAPAAYLGVLSALGLRSRPGPRSTTSNVAVVVPAHNESGIVGTTVASLSAQDYPSDKIRVYVVADNCDDATAVEATEAGAITWERVDPENRGKGFALRWAFDQLLADGWADVMIVVDADSVVDPGLASAVVGMIAGGAEAVQVDYQVRNPDASWRTRLLDVAFSCNHRVRSRARQRLGLSCGLRGNGMGFTADALRRVPYDAYSVVEDIEYGIRLADAGIRVAFCDDVCVAGDMPETSASSASQRRRWEDGRKQMRTQHLRRLAGTALLRRDPVLADLAADLATPPLATIGTRLAVGIAVALPARRWIGSMPIWILTVGASLLAAHVVAGASVSQSRWRALPALAAAPWYAVWKIGLRVTGRRSTTTEWTRTERSAALHDRQTEITR